MASKSTTSPIGVKLLENHSYGIMGGRGNTSYKNSLCSTKISMDKSMSLEQLYTEKLENSMDKSVFSEQLYSEKLSAEQVLFPFEQHPVEDDYLNPFEQHPFEDDYLNPFEQHPFEDGYLNPFEQIDPFEQFCLRWKYCVKHEFVCFDRKQLKKIHLCLYWSLISSRTRNFSRKYMSCCETKLWHLIIGLAYLTSVYFQCLQTGTSGLGFILCTTNVHIDRRMNDNCVLASSFMIWNFFLCQTNVWLCCSRQLRLSGYQIEAGYKTLYFDGKDGTCIKLVNWQRMQEHLYTDWKNSKLYPESIERGKTQRSSACITQLLEFLIVAMLLKMMKIEPTPIMVEETKNSGDLMEKMEQAFEQSACANPSAWSSWYTATEKGPKGMKCSKCVIWFDKKRTPEQYLVEQTLFDQAYRSKTHEHVYLEPTMGENTFDFGRVKGKPLLKIITFKKVWFESVAVRSMNCMMYSLSLIWLKNPDCEFKKNMNCIESISNILLLCKLYAEACNPLLSYNIRLG